MMKSRLFLCFFGGWGQRSYAYLFRGRWESLETRLDEKYNVVSLLLAVYMAISLCGLHAHFVMCTTVYYRLADRNVSLTTI